MKYILYAVLILVMFAALIAWCLFSAWIYSIAWLWLIVPVFKLPAITIYQAFALMIMVAYATFKTEQTKHDDETLTKAISIFLLRPFFLLLFAWCLKGFI